MIDMTENYKEAMDIVKSWTAPKVDSVIELAETENITITDEMMERLSSEAKARMNKKFDAVFGVNATGVRLF
jgi:hypothetical protein